MFGKLSQVEKLSPVVLSQFIHVYLINLMLVYSYYISREIHTLALHAKLFQRSIYIWWSQKVLKAQVFSKNTICFFWSGMWYFLSIYDAISWGLILHKALFPWDLSVNLKTSHSSVCIIVSFSPSNIRLADSFFWVWAFCTSASRSVKGFASFFGNKKLTAYQEETSFTSQGLATWSTCCKNITFIARLWKIILQDLERYFLEAPLLKYELKASQKQDLHWYHPFQLLVLVHQKEYKQYNYLHPLIQ